VGRWARELRSSALADTAGPRSRGRHHHVARTGSGGRPRRGGQRPRTADQCPRRRSCSGRGGNPSRSGRHREFCAPLRSRCRALTRPRPGPVAVSPRRAPGRAAAHGHAPQHHDAGGGTRVPTRPRQVDRPRRLGHGRLGGRRRRRPHLRAVRRVSDISHSQRSCPRERGITGARRSAQAPVHRTAGRAEGIRPGHRRPGDVAVPAPLGPPDSLKGAATGRPCCCARGRRPSPSRAPPRDGAAPPVPLHRRRPAPSRSVRPGGRCCPRPRRGPPRQPP